MPNLFSKRSRVSLQFEGCQIPSDQTVSNVPAALSPVDSNSYLTSVEHRLRRLEALFTELLPEVDIEQALSAGASSSHTKVLNRTSDDYVQGDQPPSEHDGVFPEAVPAEPDGFDWREETSTINELADGMAALSVEPVGTGYLGRDLVPNWPFLTFAARFYFRSCVFTIITPLDWITKCQYPLRERYCLLWRGRTSRFASTLGFYAVPSHTISVDRCLLWELPPLISFHSPGNF